jgi:DNA-binding MarR family transcriptional regulator
MQAVLFCAGIREEIGPLSSSWPGLVHGRLSGCDNAGANGARRHLTEIPFARTCSGHPRLGRRNPQAPKDDPLSLTEGRVLYELAQREHTTASELAQELGLDSGYLSRMLKSFEAKRVISKHASKSDGRQIILTLTGRGREMFATIDARSRDEIAALLGALPTSHQAQLVAALERVERLLGERGELAELAYILRPHQPGDIGWIVHRHGVLYAEEYGLDTTFEALVARIAAGFIENFDARRERCWIAERDGEIVGSVLLVRDSEESPNCDCFLSSQGLVGSALDAGSSGSVSALRAGRAIAILHCGQTTC